MLTFVLSAKFEQNIWHVRSHNAYCEPDQGSPSAKQPDLELASPSQTQSPVATPHFPTAATEPNAKQDDPNIITTNVTPPPLPQPPSPDYVPPGSQPLCVRKKNQEGPVGESWHSRKLTQAQPNSGVNDLDIKSIAPRGEASEQASQALHTIKSDSSLASGLQSGLGVTVSTGVANETKNKDKDETDVLEVWFAGCHSDVGGGAEPNDAEYSLSNISLRWMVRQIILSQCGIQFNNEAPRDMKIPLPTINLGEINLTAHDISTVDAKMIEEAQDQERRDALAPLHDTLHNPF
ncbi:hypothetical protein RSOLAG22IIIB_11810 [Rhizoctonia solani]|uniref:T6SS Phospholipase effector Tle1-like catalytic domain-containing protein n=1 Tax=Rhizoctonia solani TaxID=456999 RepID=A0A0K6GAN6_9AGAM|nr:hypothetical protein RSOLAG22IIIB_11810 [Rhizoctonia solani]